MGTAQLGEELNEEKVAAIASFLESLTGPAPEIVYPLLPVETGDTPQPTAEIVTP